MDEIRLAEVHAASLVQQAGQTAEAHLAAARAEGERCRQAALAAGQQAGETARQQHMRAAEEEAARIKVESEAAASELRQKGQSLLKYAAAWALGVVLGEEQASQPGAALIPEALERAPEAGAGGGTVVPGTGVPE